MTGLLCAPLARLAGQLADLKERVRAAVAGELGRAVSGAVQQVVQAVAAGRPVPPPAAPRPPAGRWDDLDEAGRWDRPRDRWADDPDGDDEYDAGPDRSNRRAAPARHDATPVTPPAEAGVTAAVAAAVYAARWWLGRRGTWLAAAGLGVGVGLLGVLGGPAARTAVAVLAAVGDLLGATTALGGGAARLAHL
jgi:hypothetical protein